LKKRNRCVLHSGKKEYEATEVYGDTRPEDVSGNASLRKKKRGAKKKKVETVERGGEPYAEHFSSQDIPL